MSTKVSGCTLTELRVFTEFYNSDSSVSFNEIINLFSSWPLPKPSFYFLGLVLTQLVHLLTVLTSSVAFLNTFINLLWMFAALSSSNNRNSMTALWCICRSKEQLFWIIGRKIEGNSTIFSCGLRYHFG